MSVVTLEGIVEHGQTRLSDNVRLPEKTRVYIVVPGLAIEGTARLASPRLAHPEQASDFVLDVVAEGPDAGV